MCWAGAEGRAAGAVRRDGRAAVFSVDKQDLGNLFPFSFAAGFLPSLCGMFHLPLFARHLVGL